MYKGHCVKTSAPSNRDEIVKPIEKDYFLLWRHTSNVWGFGFINKQFFFSYIFTLYAIKRVSKRYYEGDAYEVAENSLL